jgi:AraC family transcriptional regulator
MTGEQPDYIFRINKALRYIDQHLDATLDLDSIAAVAHYSPFHFHRIFKAITNESLNVYINRRRLEKAVAVLMYKPEITITELSLQFGFNSNSSFTRSFKKLYGVSPAEFRKTLPGRFSKIRQAESKNGQEQGLFEEYLCNIDNLKTWITMNAKVEIKEMPVINLACITSIGVNGLSNAYEDLVKWATPQGILNNPETRMVTVYHDSFKITSPDKVRISAGIKVNEPVEATGKVHPETIEKGRCIVGRFEITPTDFERSWSSLFIWMNENGFKKADRKPFEIYHNDYRQHPEKKCLVDFCIPVE